jgi:uncharacterized membrane protein
MNVFSAISNKELTVGEAVLGADIRGAILQFIQVKYPEFTVDSYMSLGELNTFRKQYLTSLIEEEGGELSELDKNVMDAIHGNSILSENMEETIDEKITFGQRVADGVSNFGGSWTFIISFLVFIFIWMCINVYFIKSKPFDPYPFILLNLILSCLAAIQAPIILMSQNRQSEKDRLKAENDYKVNLKAELEIKLLSEKMDHLLVHQNKKLFEIQQVQADYLEDMIKELKSLKR